MLQEATIPRAKAAVARRATPLDDRDDGYVSLEESRSAQRPKRARTVRQYRYIVLHFCKSEVLESDGGYELLHELLCEGWTPVREIPMGSSGGAHSHAWALVLLTKEEYVAAN
jgi:hypothetical protein